MAGNTFGEAFRVTTFGESHGEALGVVIDGCPAGLALDEELIQKDLDRRKPGGGSAATTSRSEADRAQLLSGVFRGKTTGTAICILIRNTSQRSKDYSSLEGVFRPGHADFTYFSKYGIRDHRGGGRASGRETAARVAAGAVARALMAQHDVRFMAWTEEAAGIKCSAFDVSQIEANPMRAPDAAAAEQMLKKIEALRAAGNSAGGIVAGRIFGSVPAGLGEPVFDKFEALLAHAMLSIGAVKAVEFGAGFAVAALTGAECNNPTLAKDGLISFAKNDAGGTLGGISTGQEVAFRLAVKPVPSIAQRQMAANEAGEQVELAIEGRHDACLCPRIVPVVEAMAALVTADLFLRNRAARVGD